MQKALAEGPILLGLSSLNFSNHLDLHWHLASADMKGWRIGKRIASNFETRVGRLHIIPVAAANWYQLQSVHAHLVLGQKPETIMESMAFQTCCHEHGEHVNAT